jgi:phosphatidylinositol alpha-1,6-mannosyltransferase
MTARPRLLILTPDYPPAPGGIQLVSERLAAGIERLQTRVLTLATPGAAEFDGAHAAAVHRVDLARLPHAGRLALLNASAMREALRFRPHLTLSMHIVASPAAAAISRSLGVPFVQYFHAEEIGARPRLAAFAALHAREAIAVSGYTAGLVRAAGAAGARITVIPNGVDVPVDATPEPVDRPTFLTVARIQERYKGHDVLVRALALVRAQVPQVQWVVLGDGSLRPGLEALARSYGVDGSIRFLGSVSDEQRNSWLRRTHVQATGRCPVACPPAGSRARASASPIWRRVRTASRWSPATWAELSTRSSTASPGCSSIRSTSWPSPRRSPRCCSIRSSRAGSARRVECGPGSTPGR